MMFFRVPLLVQLLFSRRVWKGENRNAVYLTFDDGPDQLTTPWVLDLLKKENIKATFFCIGKNMTKYPDIFQSILDDGHAIGNHTYAHEKGIKTSIDSYLQALNKTDEIHHSSLFRPPYGRINLKQVKKIKALGKKIIMWTWNAQDYKKNMNPNTIISNAKRIKGTDILLFHNSIKSKRNMMESLPSVIRIVKQKNLSFQRLS